MDGPPLVGMRKLAGYLLGIKVISGGSVSIEKLP